MVTKWNGKKYENTLFKYEHKHDGKQYDADVVAWRAKRDTALGRGGPSSIRVDHPHHGDYQYVVEYDIVGDYVTEVLDSYPYESNPLMDKWKPKRLTDTQVADARITRKNSTFSARELQARAFKKAGYHGPVGGGEARALRNLFTEMGRPELVRHGFFRTTKKVKRPPSRYQMRQAQWNNQPIPQAREVNAEVMQECYVFKSPIPEVAFDKFVKLARMYKSDKGGLRKAVVAVLKNPEAHKEVETIDCIDLLGKMVGMD